MKKILLIDRDQKFIGDLQTKFALSHEILATDNYKTALQIFKSTQIDIMLARVPQQTEFEQKKQLFKVLKKLNQKKFSAIHKILLAPDEGRYMVDEFLNQGIAAVVVDAGEVYKWIR